MGPLCQMMVQKVLHVIRVPPIIRVKPAHKYLLPETGTRKGVLVFFQDPSGCYHTLQDREVGYHCHHQDSTVQ